MTSFRRHAALLLLFFCLAPLGCAHGPARTPAPFLRGIPLAAPDGSAADTTATWRRAEALPPDAYTRVLIDPVEFWLADADAARTISHIELRALTKFLDAALYQALERRYPITASAEPGVLRVETAILDLHAAPETLNSVTSVLPVARLRAFNRLLGHGGEHVDRATVAVVLRDALTGDPVAAFTHVKEGSREYFAQDMSTTGEGEAALETWAAALSASLDRALGGAAP